MKHRLAIVLVPAVVVAALWWALLHRPVAGRVEAAQERTEQAAAQTQGLLARLTVAKADRTDPGELERTRAEFATAVPGRLDLGAFVIASEAAAERAGVVVRELAPAPPTDGSGTAPGSGITITSLRLRVDGPTAAVASFVAELQAMPRLVVVEHLAIASPDGVTSTTELGVRIFHRADGDAAAAAGVP